MKHEVYDQALKILTEKTIEEINELKDPGVESIKYVSGPEAQKLFSCSTQLRLKFILLINVKMPTIVGILKFMSRINY